MCWVGRLPVRYFQKNQSSVTELALHHATGPKRVNTVCHLDLQGDRQRAGHTLDPLLAWRAEVGPELVGLWYHARLSKLAAAAPTGEPFFGDVQYRAQEHPRHAPEEAAEGFP